MSKVGQQRSSRDIPQLDGNDKNTKTLNDLITSFNLLSRNMSFQSNFDGQIVENLTFTAGETKAIPHNLGVVPRFRIIMRQEGNGVLSDIPSSWNQYSISMKNNGAVAVTATIFIVRE